MFSPFRVVRGLMFWSMLLVNVSAFVHCFSWASAGFCCHCMNCLSSTSDSSWLICGPPPEEDAGIDCNSGDGCGCGSCGLAANSYFDSADFIESITSAADG